jgi:hypothetical protein
MSVDFKKNRGCCRLQKKQTTECVLGKILKTTYTPQLNTKMSSSQTLITKKKTKRKKLDAFTVFTFLAFYFKSDFAFFVVAFLIKYLLFFIPKKKTTFFNRGWGNFELVKQMRASVVKSVSSGRGFVNDAMVVQWDPFGEIVQTEVDGWNVVECSDIDFTREQNSTFLSKILPKHKRMGSRRTSRRDEKNSIDEKTKTKTTKTKSGGRKKNSQEEEEEKRTTTHTINCDTGIFKIKEVASLCKKSRNLSALQSGEILRVWKSSSSRRLDDRKVKRVAIVLPFTGDTTFAFRRRTAENLLTAHYKENDAMEDEAMVVLIPEFPFYGKRRVVGQPTHVISTVSEYILMHLIGLREACGLIEWARDTYGDEVSIAIGGCSMGGYIAANAGILTSRGFHGDENTNTKKKVGNNANKKLGVVSVCSWHNFEKSFAPNSYLYLRLDREQLLIKDSYVENMISEIVLSSESEASSSSDELSGEKRQSSRRVFGESNVTSAPESPRSIKSKSTSTSSSLSKDDSIFENLDWKAVLNRTLQRLVGIERLMKASGGAGIFEHKLDAMVAHFAKRDKLITSDYDEVDAIMSRCTALTKLDGVAFTYDSGDHLKNVINSKAAIVPAFLEAFKRMESSR